MISEISLRKVATIESVGSSTCIEGSKLTDRQIEDLLGRLHITEFKTRDEQEVAGYAYVMDQVFDAVEQIPVTENMIGQLHQDLLHHSIKDERHRGHYKTVVATAGNVLLSLRSMSPLSAVPHL